MLKKFGLEDYKPMKMPMSSDMKLMKDEECESVDSTKYRCMIGSLFYLMASRPDIMFSVCLCACLQEDPKTSHLEAWSLDYLEFSVPTVGLYQTTPPTPDDIKLYVQVEMEEPLTHTRHSQTIDFDENQILTREITPIMKTWFDIIRENIFCLGGNRDHVPACLCHMLYFIATSINYNLAFFVAKLMELVTKQVRLILPYGMLLTRLFNHIMSNSPELSNDRYVLYDRVMLPLAPYYERKTQKDYGTKRGRPSTFTSSSSAFDHPSSSHHVDEDDENGEGTSRVRTPSPTRFVNSLSNDVP
ncbi:hypothetical protein Tco_0511910 [Tanacetum coccineum]